MDAFLKRCAVQDEHGPGSNQMFGGGEALGGNKEEIAIRVGEQDAPVVEVAGSSSSTKRQSARSRREGRQDSFKAFYV